MKVGLFTDRYVPQTDGVSVAVDILRSELEALGHEVYVFAPKPTPRYQESLERVTRVPGIKGLWGMKEYYTTFFWPRWLLRKVEKLDLDVFHVHTPAQIGLLGVYCALENHKPLISTYHTDLVAYAEHYVSWETLPGTMALSAYTTAMAGGKMKDYKQTAESFRPNRNLVKWHQNIIINGLIQVQNCCDLVIAPSQKIWKQLTNLHSSARVVDLPTGIDRLEASDASIERWRRTLKISEQDKVVLYVGRIGTEKNIALLIRAFEIVARTDDSAKLVLVGPGEDDDVNAFKSQAGRSKAAERIIFAGEVPRSELGAFYAFATVLGFASLTDTQGLVVNEAVAAGLPVVMADREVTEAVVDGVNGYMARATARDFADKLLSIISDNDKHDEFSKASKDIAKQFTVETQVRKLVQLYQEAIKTHSVQVTK